MSIVLVLFVYPLNMAAALGELKDSITVSAVQFSIEGNQTKKSFFKKIEAQVKSAGIKKSDLIVLPEWITLDLWPIGSKKSDHDVIKDLANTFTEAYIRKLKELSIKYKTIIAGGSAPKKHGDKIFNSAFVAIPNKEIIEHRKVYLTKWETDNGLAAGQTATTFDTPWGKMALLTCYDVEFPDISVELKNQELSLIIVPSMTESQEGAKRVAWTARARAVEHTSYVVVSSTFGKTTKDWEHFGQALFLTPQLPGLSSVQLEGDPNHSGIWTSVLDLNLLRKLKATTPWRPSKQIRTR